MKPYLLVLPLLWLSFSCGNRVPEYVIEEEALENLLVDIHLSEAVIETNNISQNAEKRKIREAIFFHHGVTQEQFDTTLVWYGHHVAQYMAVYDRVIGRLKIENAEAKKLLAQRNSYQMSQPGDSVDIWTLKRYHIFDTRLSTNLLTFSVISDENFKKQDFFELRFKVSLLPRLSVSPKVYITATHTNNDIITNQLDISKEGWYLLPLQTDSAYMLKQLQGYILLPMQAIHERMYIDSLALVRRHYNESVPEVKEQKYMAREFEKNPFKKLKLKR